MGSCDLSLLLALRLLLLSSAREAALKDSRHHLVTGRSSKWLELDHLRSVKNSVGPVPCTAVAELHRTLSLGMYPRATRLAFAAVIASSAVTAQPGKRR